VLTSNSLAQVNANEILVEAQEINNLGYESLTLGDTLTAKRCFLQAINLDDRVREAYINLNAIYQKDSLENAVKIMEQASLVFVDDDEVWYYLGNSYYRCELYEKAIKAYGSAIELSKVNGEDFGLVWSYYFNKANVLAKLQYYQESIQFYSEAIEFNPNHPTIYFNRGMIYYMCNQNEMARKDWQKAGELGMNGVQEYIEKYLK